MCSQFLFFFFFFLVLSFPKLNHDHDHSFVIQVVYSHKYNGWTGNLQRKRQEAKQKRKKRHEKRNYAYIFNLHTQIQEYLFFHVVFLFSPSRSIYFPCTVQCIILCFHSTSFLYRVGNKN